MVDTPQGYIGATSQKSKVTTAMIFDYDAIVDKYGIDIDIVSGVQIEEEEARDVAADDLPTLDMQFGDE